MGHGIKKTREIKKVKVWKILDGTYKPKKKRINGEDGDRLIAAMQQEIYWDQRDIDTWDEIQADKIDWSGQRVRSKRKS